MKTIAFVGLIGSGKDTAASYLIEKHEYTKYSFAGTLKDACANIFGWDREMLEGKTPESREWREQIDEWWANRLGMPNFSPRYALQYVGTDILRNRFHQDIWVLSLQRSLLDSDTRAVISDARFRNEIVALRQLGAVIVEVSRGPKPEWWSVAVGASSGDPESIDRIREIGIHHSEWDWASVEPDYVLDNTGTIQDLHNQLEYLMTR